MRSDGSRVATERVEDYTFFYGLKNGDHQLGTGFFVHKRIISAVRRVESVSDRMSYTTLRGRWCNIIVLNVHAPCEDKRDGVKDSFYEKLGRVFDQFPRYHMKIFIGEFNANLDREKFANRQSRTRVHTKLAMIIKLE
jgi:hypothetical protein